METLQRPYNNKYSFENFTAGVAIGESGNTQTAREIKREQALGVLTVGVSMASTLMNPRPHDTGEGEDLVIGLGLSAFAGVAKGMEWATLRDAGFKSRRAFYEQGLRWLGEDWVEKTVALSGQNAEELRKDEFGIQYLAFLGQRIDDNFRRVSNEKKLFEELPIPEREKLQFVGSSKGIDFLVFNASGMED